MAPRGGNNQGSPPYRPGLGGLGCPPPRSSRAPRTVPTDWAWLFVRLTCIYSPSSVELCPSVWAWLLVLPQSGRCLVVPPSVRAIRSWLI